MKWLFTIVTLALALLAWFIGVTVPMNEAAAPIIIAIFLTGITWYFWPGRRDPKPDTRYHDKPYADDSSEDSDNSINKYPDAN